jgi:hypothetical protein
MKSSELFRRLLAEAAAGERILPKQAEPSLKELQMLSKRLGNASRNKFQGFQAELVHVHLDVKPERTDGHKDFERFLSTGKTRIPGQPKPNHAGRLNLTTFM